MSHVLRLGGGCPWTRSLNFLAVQSTASNELDVAGANAKVLEFTRRQTGQFVNRTAVIYPGAVFFTRSVKHLLLPYAAAFFAIRVVVDFLYNSPSEIKEVPEAHDRHAIGAMQ
ncbi:hypothetical protein [Roseibium sp.]|uniref:hypothetical protein n=1 Tax=Roseibium sp. TaxID=1936156 RepID=UPI003BADB1BE